MDIATRDPHRIEHLTSTSSFYHALSFLLADESLFAIELFFPAQINSMILHTTYINVYRGNFHVLAADKHLSPSHPIIFPSFLSFTHFNLITAILIHNLFY